MLPQCEPLNLNEVCVDTRFVMWIAGIMMFVACAGIIVSCDDYVNTGAYRDGQSADGIVVSNISDNGYHHGVVEYTTSDGQVRQSQLANEEWVAPGTELRVSYRPSDPSTVRAPELRSVGASQLVGLPLLFVAGLLLMKNPAAAERNRTRLKGAIMSDPELLLREVKVHIEPQLGRPIHAAFPVMERVSMNAILLPFSLFCVALLIAAQVVGGEDAGVAAVLAICVAPAFLLLVFVRRRAGIVCLTDDEFVLFVAPGRDLTQVSLDGRLPRNTPLPDVRRYKFSVIGGPVPFPARKDSQGWYYRADFVTNSYTNYLDLINDIVVDSRARAGGDHRNSSLDVYKHASVSFDLGPVATDRGAGRLSADGYGTRMQVIHHLAPEPVIGAFPVRQKSETLAWFGFLFSKRRHSVLVTDHYFVVVSHRLQLRFARREATISLQKDLHSELARLGLRAEQTMTWIDQYVEELAA